MRAQSPFARDCLGTPPSGESSTPDGGKQYPARGMQLHVYPPFGECVTPAGGTVPALGTTQLPRPDTDRAWRG